jgi:O-antigen/teichoic acid export membrane protein
MASLITGLVTYRWIDPYYIGIWQSLVLLESYSIFLRMGIINGMNRELPYNMGQGNIVLAHKYAQTTLYFTLVNIGTFVLLAFIVLPFLTIPANYTFPLIAVLVIVSVNFYTTYLFGTFRANADFDRLSRIQIVQAILKIVSILLVIYAGFDGFVIREVALVIIIAGLAHNLRPMKDVRPSFNKKIFTDLLRVGLPIFISSYIIIFLNTVPRLLLLKYGTIAMLGIYAPLLTIISAVTVLPDSITTYLYPKMTQAIGRNNDRLAIWRKALYSHLGLLVLGIPIVIACLIAVPWLIDHVIPKYTESKSIISIGVFTALFMSYKFGYTTLITLKAWKLIVVYVLAFALLQFGVPLIFLLYLPVLKAVVIGQLVASAGMVMVSLSTNYLATHNLSYNLLQRTN